MEAHPATVRSARLPTVVLAVGCGLALALHVRSGHHFPVPWPDEIDFLTPATTLARHGTLRVPQLASPDGMFWMSDAYYFLLAPVVRLAGGAVDTARWVSLLAILVAGCGFSIAAWRTGASRVAASLMVAAWLVSPRVVLAGNIGRHEAIVLALVAWSLVATVSGRRVGAVALAGWACAVHPAAAPFGLLLTVANLRRGQHRTEVWEWIALGTLGLFVMVELARFLPNIDVAREQLRFQLQRKRGRQTFPPTPVLAAGLLAIAGGLVALRHDPRRHLLLIAGLAAAGWATLRVGDEIWYEVYGRETAVLLLGLSLLGLIAMMPVRHHSLLLVAGTAAFAGALLGNGVYADGFYGMRLQHDSHEWDTFVRDVRGALTRLSAESTEPRSVTLNELSGLPWPAETDRIGNLRLVKETLTTRASGGDYLLFARTICCGGKELLPGGDVVTTIASPHGVFDATLYRLGG